MVVFEQFSLELMNLITHNHNYLTIKPTEMTSVSATTNPYKRILITGSSGYVGQHLIASLLRGGTESSLDGRHVATLAPPRTNTNTIAEDDVAGEEEEVQYYELFCAYNSLSTFEKDLDAILSHQPAARANIHLIPNIDFSQPNYFDAIQEAIGGGGHHDASLDAIVHLAALSSPGYCEQNASLAYQVNCPIELLKFNAPIIYLSTDQVYEGTKQYYEEDSDETVPVNVYGRSKLAFERVLLRGCGDNRPLLTEREMGNDIDCKRHLQAITDDDRTIPSAHLNSVILRCSLILGPPTPLANGCKKGAYPSFLQFIEGRLRSSTPTEYFVNEYRSVVDIHDVIKAIHHFLENGAITTSSIHESTTVRTYNLGGSTRASRFDIAMAVAGQLNLDSSSAMAVNRPSSDGGNGVPSPPDISMNIEKITREVNAMKGLKEIVASTYP